MPNQIILDNWTLQEIKDIYENGLVNRGVGKIIINSQNDSHSYKEIPHGIVQLESLFNFLQNLILRDTIYVDERFTNTWDSYEGLSDLKESGIIKPHRFQKMKFVEVRKAILDKLCVTSSIKKIQKKNEEKYEESQTVHDEYISAVFWGGAGMLARSHVYETYYLPHPLRKAAFVQTPLLKRDAVDEVLNFIETNKVKLFHFKNESGSGQHAQFILPPLITDIIQEANDAADCIRIAMQLRDYYQDLREWIREYQKALDKDDPKKIAEFTKTLNSVKNNIESKYKPTGNSWMKLGFDIFSLSPSLEANIPINKLFNKVGIKSTLNELVLSPSGIRCTKKILKLFGEHNSILSKKIYDELATTYSKN